METIVYIFKETAHFNRVSNKRCVEQRSQQDASLQVLDEKPNDNREQHYGSNREH